MTQKSTQTQDREAPPADAAPSASLQSPFPILSVEHTGNSRFPIVGIGASAGGLEALEQFFSAMPGNTGMAFVVIQHLDPTHTDFLPELLQRVTSMMVVQASEQCIVRPNCVYVIPPNKSMSVLHGALRLFDRTEHHGIPLPIDAFFTSLADDRGDASVGIILSGMGSDGSLGCTAIKAQHGIVMVQDPATAKYDAMPNSAIAAVQADIIASPDLLPAELMAVRADHPETADAPEMDDAYQGHLERIVLLLRSRTGHDFSQYKKNSLARRIERRKGIHQIPTIPQYVLFLQENPKEIDILFKELLIGVTGFFRDADVWDQLKEHLTGSLLTTLPAGTTVRAWIPGCSTGEEAYTLAITFIEALESMPTPADITLQIFATDLDLDAIEFARKGLYPKGNLSAIAPERLQRFFTDERTSYRIRPFVRERIIFAAHNIIKDPPFTKLDLLTCRNMLIYFETELQQKMITLFNYCLRTGGMLVLGTAETLGARKAGFETIDAKRKIFKRVPAPLLPELYELPRTIHRTIPMKHETVKSPDTVVNLQNTVEQMLLRRFAPPGVVVNASGDILYLSGMTAKYLSPAAGKANWNIHVMAREGLRQVLPSVFRAALTSNEPVLIRNITIETDGGPQSIDITVQHLDRPESLHGLIIVVFNDASVALSNEQAQVPGPRSASKGRQKELEKALQGSYEELQRMRMEMQTSQEELRSTNEELQSSNEELQSTNEELTTSKEEMQSLNEELQTVNNELQSKVNDFVQANNDMKNLLNSTEIATLFLDKELNIRRYTDAVCDIIKLRAGDIGRPFTDLVNTLDYPEISTHAKQVIKTLTTIETAITTKDDRWFTVRIMPYRTMDDRIDGLVITFMDITIAKHLEIDLKRVNEELQRQRNTHIAP